MPIVGPGGQILIDDRVPLRRILNVPAPDAATWHHAALLYALAHGMRDENDTVAVGDIERLWVAVMDLGLGLNALRHDPGCELARETGEAPDCVCTPVAVLSTPKVGEILYALQRPQGGG